VCCFPILYLIIYKIQYKHLHLAVIFGLPKVTILIQAFSGERIIMLGPGLKGETRAQTFARLRSRIGWTAYILESYMVFFSYI
jgi:hypothetical protein